MRYWSHQGPTACGDPGTDKCHKIDWGVWLEPWRIGHIHTWNMRALPPKNQVPRRMTIMMLRALARVPPRYSQLLRFAIIAACQDTLSTPAGCISQHMSHSSCMDCLLPRPSSSCIPGKAFQVPSSLPCTTPCFAAFHTEADQSSSRCMQQQAGKQWCHQLRPKPADTRLHARMAVQL